ncbi:hypothetical protein OGAPHI_003420 [Ogataea philodendri]|uniref:GPI transamidase component GAB1 n=1 Tax=Ogataea philodendri TaxID=1378263 RepID=A0A9P8P8I1_9ASCO|nr:uncharacterized protein OGAPHI_003420 [Ogataea philodendri]KAH3666970.1 hypothetical protein OGAPHI_003420 [Ogataea philodendri]
MAQQTYLILTAGFLIRWVLPTIFPSITTILDKSVLFSTPISSFRSLQEGIFLLSNSIDPYNGEIVHFPPLLLLVFSKISQLDLVFAALDTLTGYLLVQINKKTNYSAKYSSWIIAAFYALNPLAILTTLSKSTTVINNLTLLYVFHQVLSKNYKSSVISLAVSSYLTYYNWYFVVPVLYSIYQNTASKHAVIRSIALYLASISALLYSSYVLTNNSFRFLYLNYCSTVLFKKIIPNIGLWWYFFTEIFEFFNSFYLAVFNIYSFIFVIPLTLRFPNDLLFASWILIGFLNFAKPYPTVTDLNLFYSMLIVFKVYYKKLKFSPFLSYVGITIILTLLPVFYYVWMCLNSGNANFFYAIGLVLSVLQTIIVSDFLWSKIQTEYFQEQGLDLDAIVKLTQI